MQLVTGEHARSLQQLPSLARAAHEPAALPMGTIDRVLNMPSWTFPRRISTLCSKLLDEHTSVRHSTNPKKQGRRKLQADVVKSLRTPNQERTVPRQPCIANGSDLGKATHEQSGARIRCSLTSSPYNILHSLLKTDYKAQLSILPAQELQYTTPRHSVSLPRPDRQQPFRQTSTGE